jgi:hypothetical protein
MSGWESFRTEGTEYREVEPERLFVFHRLGRQNERCSTARSSHMASASGRCVRTPPSLTGRMRKHSACRIGP